MKLPNWLFRILAVGLWAPVSFADQERRESMELMSSSDTTIYNDYDREGNPIPLSNGAGNGLFVGLNGLGSMRRALLRFDLSTLPAAVANIYSADLILTTAGGNIGPQKISLHRLTADWGEGDPEKGSQGYGSGASATPKDATWVYSFFDTQRWQVAGGDYVRQPSATVIVDADGSYIWSAEGVLNDLKFWARHPDLNFGWMVVSHAKEHGTAKVFASREHAAVDKRPQLRIVLNTATPETL